MLESRLKVCHIITRLIVGGAQENTVASCAFVDPSRFASFLVTGPQTGAEGELHSEAARLSVRSIVVPSLVREVSPQKDLKALTDLVAILRRERPAIVHTHSSKAGVLGRIAARLVRTPVIIHTVHGWSFHDEMSPLVRRAYILAERRLAPWCAALIVVAERDREKGLRERIGRVEQYRTIRSGIDLDPFARPRRSRAEMRRELGIPVQARVVGTVGRLSAQKDPLTFIETARRIRAAVPDAHFVMVGDGPLRDAVESRAAAAGLTDRLRLTGLRRDVGELLQAFDLFLLTSRWEGLPRVLPQAMAAGVPIVATAIDGSAEAITDGGNGFIAPPGDSAILAARAIQLLEDPALAASLVNRGRERVAGFDVRTMVTQLGDLYDETFRRRTR